MINLERLEDLKIMLSTEKTLAKVWTFYMDHFADHLEFIKMGKPTHHSLVEKVVPVLTKQMFDAKPKDFFLIILPEHQFIHGGFKVGKRIGGVIYFEESLTGMVAVSGFPPSSLVKYSRFSGTPIGQRS